MPNRTDSLSAQDRIVAWTKRLYSDFDHILYTYRLKLARPLIQIVEAKGFYGEWNPELRQVKIAASLIRDYPWYVVLEVFKHELAHMLADEGLGLRGRKELERQSGPHGASFKAACERLGVESWARHASVDLGEKLDLEQVYALSPEEAKVQARVEKLLSLSGSSNEHEAMLATRKAKDLQIRYNLENLREHADETAAYVTKVISFRRKRVEAWQAKLCSILCRHFFVDVVFSATFDAERFEESKAFEILGTPPNVSMAEYVYHFLERTILQLWVAYQGLHQVGGLRERRSYLLGLLHGFSRHLEQTDSGPTPTSANRDPSTARSTSSEQALPALSQSEAAMLKHYRKELENFVHRRFPRLRKSYGSNSRVISSHFQAGVREGANIRVRKPLGGGGPSQGRFFLGSGR